MKKRSSKASFAIVKLLALCHVMLRETL